MIREFCEDVHKWLSADEKNVVAIHCKAGKGRTGCMICMYMLYTRQWTEPAEALKYYGLARTQNGKVASGRTRGQRRAAGGRSRAGHADALPRGPGAPCQGVTIPSQIRYVYYYGEVLNKGLVYEPKTMFLKKIIIHTIPRITSNGCCTLRSPAVRAPERWRTLIWRARGRPRLSGVHD